MFNKDHQTGFSAYAEMDKSKKTSSDKNPLQMISCI